MRSGRRGWRPALLALGIALAASPALGQEPPEEPARGSRPSQPRPRSYVPPRYPEAAEKAGIEGSVILQLDVDRAGKVTRAVVVNPAGHGFDEAAVEASKALEFEPARKADGTPVAARILYRYVFRLERAEPPPEEPALKAAEVGLSGAIRSSEGDAPIAGARVSAEGPAGSASATTDEEGAFSLRGLSPGRYAVRVEAAGYRPLLLEEDLGADGPLEIVYRLSTAGSLEVFVRGERAPREVVKRTLERREINRIPGTNGDALRSVQNLPGVARSPGIAGVLLVRGSSPQDTQTFVDGTPVPLIYHFGGLSSVIPTELLDRIDFYPGNFGAEFGRGMGGVVDAGLRSPKEDGRYHGLLQADLIDVRALLEGPVPLAKGWRFAAAGRRSYFDTWLGPVLEAAGAGVTQAPVYYDYQLLAETDPRPGERLRFAFFGSDDALRLVVGEPAPGEPAISGNVGLHTAFQRLQARYRARLGEGEELRATLALGRDALDFGFGPFFFAIESLGVTSRLELSSRLSRRATMNVGLDAQAGSYDVALRLPQAPRPGEPPGQPFSTRAVREVAVEGFFALPATYAELEITPSPRARVVPGLRLDYFDLTGRLDASPRLSARYDVTQKPRRTTLKAGVGVYHQPPQFQEVVPPLGTEGVDSNRAIHYALGAEREITRQVETSVEGFYKQLDELVVGVVAPGGVGTTYRNTGEGAAFGTELLLKYKPDARFFGWLAYTLSRSTRRSAPGEEERLVAFDQTHILTLLGSYKLGRGWEIGTRFRLVSGNLITPNVCDSASERCDPNRASGLFHAPSGTYTPLPFSGPATERLPLFHQLDVRVDKRWKFKTFELSAYLDVQNVYNNANVEGVAYNFNYTARTFVSGIPLLPSLGLRADF